MCINDLFIKMFISNLLLKTLKKRQFPFYNINSEYKSNTTFIKFIITIIF